MLVHRARLRLSRPSHQQRGPQGFLIHEALVEPAVFAKEKPLVGGVDHHRVLLQSGCFQVVEQGADRIIQRPDAGEVVRHVALVLPAHHVVALRTLLEHARADLIVDLVPLLSLLGVHAVLAKGDHLIVEGQVHGHPQGHVLGVGRRAAALVVIKEVLRLRVMLAGVFLQVLDRGQPESMRRLVLDHQHERLFLVPSVLEPGDGFFNDGLGYVFTRLSRRLAGRSFELRCVVGSLAGEHVPEVEALGLGSEMPFSDESGLVAALLQELREGLLVTIEHMVVFEEAIQMGVLAGLDNGPAGPAQGVGDEAVVKPDPFAGYPVEVRGGGDVLEASSIG